jgi:uncharacterized membrane protein YcaP (DUF421 family)
MAYRAAMFGGSIDLGYTIVAIVVWGAVSYLLARIFIAKNHLKGARA